MTWHDLYNPRRRKPPGQVTYHLFFAPMQDSKQIREYPIAILLSNTAHDNNKAVDNKLTWSSAVAT